MSHKLFLIPVIFFAISFVFSMLGMGGSQLYIPILYWFGMNFKHEAIPMGLLLNILTSGSAALTYYRSGLVRLRLALPFAVSMVVWAPVGAFLDLKVKVAYVILVFALFTIISAVLVITGFKPKKKIESKKAELILGVTAGSVLGLIVGFAGRGGGAMVVPILLMSGLEPKVAAATSSFIVTLSAVSGFLGHLPHARFNIPVTLGCSVAVVLGSRMGAKLMAQKMKPRALKYVFSAVLLAVGLLLLKDALTLMKM
ncbi:MAG: sulfite exporter TauE/SafE family protein [Deferribacteres bacterium]|nr:sulfite exporter TauE/SafE family protein [Deferribacteres bacterium]